MTFYFQGYYCFDHTGMDRNMREQFRGHPHFEHTERLCEIYDNPAFDPKLECAPLDYLELMVRRLFSSPKNSIYQEAAQKAGMAN
jgi:hypothetical protein